MYTEICPELGEAMAATSSAPYIKFNLILYFLLRNQNLTVTASGPPHINEHLTGIYRLLMGQSRVKMTIVTALLGG